MYLKSPKIDLFELLKEEYWPLHWPFHGEGVASTLLVNTSEYIFQWSQIGLQGERKYENLTFHYMGIQE